MRGWHYSIYQNSRKRFGKVKPYFDDIIFRSTNESLSKEFSETNEFKTSMMSELNSFSEFKLNKGEKELSFLNLNTQTSSSKNLISIIKKMYLTLISTSVKLDRDERVDQNYMHVVLVVYST